MQLTVKIDWWNNKLFCTSDLGLYAPENLSSSHLKSWEFRRVLTSDLPNESGAVVSLWRNPVKSMLGEKLNAAAVNDGGLLGDEL